MPSELNTVPVWVLLGAKHGDNQQLLAIAEAMNQPYRVIPLHFNRAARLPPLLLGTRRLSWRTECALQPPWPQAVLAAGRRSVPAARWIRRQSGGQTRLIHINRPWAPLAWFDLIVTTPQYAVPRRANVLTNLMPFVLPAQDDASVTSLADLAAGMPRPWTVVLVGGNSRPYVLNKASARLLAQTVNDKVRETGGSAWVLGSPRTQDAAMATIEATLRGPAHVSRWGQGQNLYRPLLREADRFIVTADSASMLTEALLSGRTVTPFTLPARPHWRWRFASAWRAAAERRPTSAVARAYAWAVDLGLLSAVRDIGHLQRALTAAGMFGADGRPQEVAALERRATLARITQTITSG
ncbi:MAG: mitochondrial fission ELM1 family protein [Burkholderiaceae bacterium]|nr:mitochondrial fission ELM1 family protein [Burkholderiaceae bacterium]